MKVIKPIKVKFYLNLQSLPLKRSTPLLSCRTHLDIDWSLLLPSFGDQTIFSSSTTHLSTIWTYTGSPACPQESFGLVKPRTSQRVLFAIHNKIVLVSMSFKSSYSSVDIFFGLSFSLDVSHWSSVIFLVLQVFTFKALIVHSRVSKLFICCYHKMKSPRPSKSSIEMLEPFTDSLIPFLTFFYSNFFL